MNVLFVDLNNYGYWWEILRWLCKRPKCKKETALLFIKKIWWKKIEWNKRKLSDLIKKIGYKVLNR